MHSPFRSEADVFRGALVVLLGAGAVVAVGVITEAAIAGIAAAALVGVAVGLVLRAGRGSLPESWSVAEGESGVHRILVLANQTVEGAELLEEITNRARGHERVRLLVVCPTLTRSRLELVASDTDRAREEADGRLARSLEAIRGLGLEAEGTIGDEDPVVAVGDALGTFGADEIVISTHPPARSRWLERGVVEAVRGQVELPVTHVVVEGAAETADARAASV